MASTLEEKFAWQIKVAGLPQPVREYRFMAQRRWRFDFAWPEHKLAAEVEGGIYQGKSRHTNGAGFEKDCEKYNTAAIAGWKVLRFGPKAIKGGGAVTMLSAAMAGEAWQDYLFG